MIKTVVNIAASLLLSTISLYSLAEKAAESEPKVLFTLEAQSCGLDSNVFMPFTDMLLELDTQTAVKFVGLRIDQVYGEACNLSGLAIYGEITAETLNFFELGLELLNNRYDGTSSLPPTLYLSSEGGLLSVAMEIGELTAKNELTVFVPWEAVCASACVAIYAAGDRRGNLGKIAIHRAFSSELSTEDLSYSEYLEQYEALTPLLKSYFTKFGVSASIVDDMNTIPSDDFKILSEVELSAYGLGYSNVAAMEYKKARTIEKCGTDFHDLEQSWEALSEQCQSEGTDILECFGLSDRAFPTYRDERAACEIKLGN